MMETYEIWMEGYAATKESDTAQYVGSIRAESFKEACIKFSKTEEAIEKQWDEFLIPQSFLFGVVGYMITKKMLVRHLDNVTGPIA